MTEEQLKSSWNGGEYTSFRINSQLTENNFFCKMGKLEEWHKGCEVLEMELAGFLTTTEGIHLEQLKKKVLPLLNKYLNIKKNTREDGIQGQILHAHFSETHQAIKKLDYTLRELLQQHNLTSGTQDDPRSVAFR